MKGPGIVSVMRFERPGGKHFAGYINYINRSDALREQHFKDWNAVSFDGYNQYLENPQKSTGIFTAGRDQLDLNARKALRREFVAAEKNGSVMWQIVVSFDNAFLQALGLDQDQPKLRNAIRTGMRQLLVNEGLENSAVWSASIHLNTDNLHVHIAVVEPKPQRRFIEFERNGEVVRERKGYLKAGTLNTFKSTVANQLVNRDQSLAQISTLIRERLSKHVEPWYNLPDRQLINAYQEIFSRLPDDRRQWRYNMSGMAHLRPLLDGFASRYLMIYHKTELEIFDDQLLKEVQFREFLYGKGQIEATLSQGYYDHKYDELYARMGNSVLKEMLAQDRAAKQGRFAGSGAKAETTSVQFGVVSALGAIKRLLRGEVNQHLLNMEAHDRAARETEQRRNSQNQDFYR